MLEENKAIARRFLHMFEQGDPSVADEIVAADYYNHDSPNPELGREGVKAFVIGFKEGLPDAQVDIEIGFFCNIAHQRFRQVNVEIVADKMPLDYRWV